MRQSRQSPQTRGTGPRPSKPVAEGMFAPPLQRGVMAQHNRSQRLVRVLRYFVSLGEFLLADKRVEGTSSEGPEEGERVVTVETTVSPQLFFQVLGLAPSTALHHYPPVEIVNLFRRTDIPLPTHITEKHLRRLEELQAEAQHLPPAKAAERFHGCILLAKNFDLARQVDEAAALEMAASAENFEALVMHAERYGKEHFPYDTVAPAVIRAAPQNPQAQRVLTALARKPSGRKPEGGVKRSRRQQIREAKHEFDERVRQAREALRAAISAERNKLPSAVWRNASLARTRRREIEDAVLARYCASTNAPERKAGELEKVLILQQRSQVHW